MSDHKNHLIIFSKNRACQLHLLLESIFLNAPSIFSNITVLYKADSEFCNNYNTVKTIFPSITFIRETNFNIDLLKTISEEYSLTTFIVDDAVIYEHVPPLQSETKQWIYDEKCIFSLRLGLNCKYSHPANIHYSITNYSEAGNCILLDYCEQEIGDFSYPLSTDGHIYSTKLIKSLLSITPFKDPNTLEANIQQYVGTQYVPTKLKCFKNSKLVSIPINLVNTSITNRNGLKHHLSAKQLNDNYTNGQIIDFKKIPFKNINGPHKELPFTFKRDTNPLHQIMTSVTDDQHYPTFCKKAATEENAFITFKSHPTYTTVLEHVTYEQGLDYLKRIKLFNQFTDELSKFRINDTLGSPTTYNYGECGTFSPTTLRYVKILTDLSQLDLNDKHIVEIGAGYGGQYATLRQVYKPKSYTFIDLPEVLELIKKYVSKLKLDDIEINYVNGKKLNSVIESDLLLSNYAFSECITSVQDTYIANVLQHARHGYMICNNSNGYTHDKIKSKINKPKALISAEVPKTHYKNVLLTW